MKRFLSISLLSLYLVFSAGLVVSLHYCGGSLAALKLFVKASCCCDDEETGSDEDCCKDEIKTVKITDDQFKEEQSTLAFKYMEFDADTVLPIPFSLYNDWVDTPQVITLQALPRPPDNAILIPPYKLYHAYLFYS